MEGVLRLTKVMKAAVLKVAETIEETCEAQHIKVIKPETPEGVDDPFLVDLMKRGFSISKVGDCVRVGIFGVVKGVSVSIGNGQVESTDQEFPVSISELVSLWP